MASNANAEEAVSIATEYISSIDNLHNEVQFLLGEIRHKDYEVVELESKIYKKAQDIFGRKGASAGPAKEQANIEKTREYLDKMDKLADDKVRLATRLERLMVKTVGRLDYDLGRIHRISGEAFPQPSIMTPVRAAAVIGHTPMYTQSSVHLPEAVIAAPSPVPTVRETKRRRLDKASSVLSGVNNTPITLTHVTDSRGRNTPQQAHVPAASPAPPSRRREATRSVPVEDMEADEEAGDGDANDGDGGDDDTPYCYCQKPSYGEMIACDNPGCQYEWFHLSCLGLRSSPKGAWFCDDCAANRGGADQVVEKGRKRAR